MEIGFIGLGRMGANMVRRLLRGGHRGIKYGMLIYGEGFEILNASQYDLDLHAIAHLWNQGSVVRSWLSE
jgi:6-phosphogluconate dehydrogenase